MDMYQSLLIITTFLCTLVTGFLFAFAVVVMPGISKLQDREFIQAFQVIDGVIQNNQPTFILVWIGSVFTLIASALFSFTQLDNIETYLILVATLVYIFGVQLPTISINIPLNNRLQSIDVNTLNETAQKAARQQFETRWNYWNLIRTFVSSLVSILLIILLLKL